MEETGVSAEFRASHHDPRCAPGERHWHTFHVDAWFPTGSDGRVWLEDLDRICTRLDGTHLEKEYAWCEPLAKVIGEFMPSCAEVVVRRDHERIHGRWRRS